MKPRLQLVLIVCTTLLLSGIGSHIAARVLGLRIGAIGYKRLGAGNDRLAAFVEGSSLMLDGLSWERVSQVVGGDLENWFVAGSSPTEWEQLQSRAQPVKLSFIVVSAYDLNESFLCDYRPEIVPLSRAIQDILHSRADWPFAKRVLSQYPLRYLRVIFPTVGRSDGFMVGVRKKLSGLLRPLIEIKTEASPTISSGKTLSDEEPKTEKISDWTRGRVLRRLATMQAACQGRHEFDGPKRLALLRMLNYAQSKGRVVVVVLPVSPTYATQFLTTEVSRQFENVLADMKLKVPGVRWMRLDRLSELNSDEYFWDLVHMNAYGQRIATDAFLGEFQTLGSN